MDRLIWKQLALLKFAIIPGILGGIACFIGTPHSTLIKSAIGVVIGCAIQNRYMVKAIKDTLQNTYRVFDEIFEDKE